MSQATWKTTRIDQMGRIVTGKTPSSQHPEEFGDRYPFITPSDIPATQKHVSTERFLSERGMEKHKRIGIPKKSTCVVCIGATVGKTCMAKGLSISNQQINSIVPFQGQYDPDFVYYISTKLRDSLVAFAGGSATPIINKSVFSSIKLLVPDHPTQRKIAAILSAYDELIENNKRRIALLEKMAEEIYREWFVRLRFPGHEKVKVRKGIPDGWDQKLLPEIANITYGFPFDGSRFNNEGRGKPIIRIRNIPDSSTGDYTDEVTDEKFIVRTGDFLVGMDGEFHMNHWTGEDAYLVQRVCRIKAKDPELDGFLAQAVRAPVKHYESILLGATVGHLGAVHLKRIYIMLPPETLRRRLRVFNDLLKQKLLLAAATRNLARTRDLLLPRLISGKLSVENLDIQFPPGMMEEYENPPLSPLHKKGGSGGSEAED